MLVEFQVRDVQRFIQLYDQTFSNKRNLKIHIDTLHKGVKHTCDICGKKFSQKHYLKIHIDSVHNGVTHACDVCGKKFVNKKKDLKLSARHAQLTIASRSRADR
uniref:C2H2-type domain-containing protein n=1 Tax=Trichogramma kaykai TaxID=54128 RepID=A0ABD2XC38_9HYME